MRNYTRYARRKMALRRFFTALSHFSFTIASSLITFNLYTCFWFKDNFHMEFKILPESFDIDKYMIYFHSISNQWICLFTHWILDYLIMEAYGKICITIQLFELIRMVSLFDTKCDWLHFKTMRYEYHIKCAFASHFVWESKVVSGLCYSTKTKKLQSQNLYQDLM